MFNHVWGHVAPEKSMYFFNNKNALMVVGITVLTATQAQDVCREQGRVGLELGTPFEIIVDVVEPVKADVRKEIIDWAQETNRALRQKGAGTIRINMVLEAGEAVQLSTEAEAAIEAAFGEVQTEVVVPEPVKAKAAKAVK